jgi:hypothetical protein
MSGKDELESRIGILISGLKILDIPFLLTEQYPKGLGNTIPSIGLSLEGVTPIEKMAFSCCNEAVFMKTLLEYNRKTIIIAGIEAHVCVLQTVVDLFEKGYKPVVIEDCISSRKLNDKKIAIKRFLQEGAVLSTCESVLLELARISGTNEFKAISKLIK